ncbi:MAG TPA: chemotaxis response regulator protein-glutamate methylesterase [Vicinamibacteria bacterium]|nr:chemotaxis response regulator protein-glutamate methylesterase [Vicinamibacteria bacterium]
MERRPIRALVVDDSATMRKTLSTILSRDPGIEVVATAVDGLAALRKLARFRPDVVTLDLEMPGMDGLDVLREMVAQSEAPVLVVSAYTPRGADLTVTALSLGAVDAVAKPGPGGGGVEAMASELLAKVHAVAGRRWRRPPTWRITDAAAVKPLRRILHPAAARTVVAVGVSTGGPAALNFLIPRLPAELPAAMVVVQHMPVGFTEMLAQRLNQASAVQVREARDGEPLRNGTVLIAPAGRHIRVRHLEPEPIVLLGGGPAVSGHCPSADVLFHSVAAEFGRRSVGVLLTGMGEDGASGLLAVRRMGGRTLAQDEESSVVFGMPKAAILRGAVEQVLPLERMPDAITAATYPLETAVMSLAGAREAL